MSKSDCGNNGKPPGAIANPYTSAEVGDIVQLGGYDWRVLDVKDVKALVISDRILTRREYGAASAWENCDLRQYLNGSFYGDTFSERENALIAESKITNQANPRYNTTNGADTLDKVFLLSVEEVVRYFGDSGQLACGLKYISDEYNAARVARDKDNEASWRWLRSPGDPGNLAVCVGDDGGVYVTGHGVTTASAGVGGIRPALWLNLES